MTYFGFLLVFLCLPLLVLAALAWRDNRRQIALPRARAAAVPWVVLLVHVALAVVYTTPWDNYLVATRVWYYDPARVTGLTLGWVPIEEYCFFVLQTLFTGGWLLWLARRLPAPQPAHAGSPALNLVATALAGILWLAAVAILVLRWQPGTYLALTLAWMLPPVMLQLAVGARYLWQHRGWVALGLLPPLLYLSAADSLAIANGVWAISPSQTTGVFLGVLPVEEFAFFTITNVLIVFGMVLMLAGGHELRRDLARFLSRVRARPDDAQDNNRPARPALRDAQEFQD